MITVSVIGGPFDGAALQVPRRTPPGLRLTLVDHTVAGEYLLARSIDARLFAAHVLSRGRVMAWPDEAAVG